jgi:hypothetical protein
MSIDLRRLLSSVLLGLSMLLTGIGAPIGVAYAALNDACMTTDPTPLPGLEISNGSCVATTSLSTGLSCGTTGSKDYFYNASEGICVADGDVGPQCTNGIYFAGVCEVPPTPTPPTAPTPAGFTGLTGSGGDPSGSQQPMCVNASPFVGYGLGIVAGTVLCYTGAGKMMGINAYTDSGSDSVGVGPINFESWNSLSLRDLFAGDDITALGTLSVYGNAQIYSANGYNGMQITDEGILMRAQNALANNEISSFELTDQQIKLLSTDGTSSAGLEVSFTEGASLTAYLEGTGTPSDGAAVNIDGRIGAASTAGVGVLITGSGQGDKTAPTNGLAGWSDVQVASANYGTLYGAANGLGSAIIVNDYGVQVKAPELRDGGASYNEFASGANNEAGSSLVNSIGAGGAGTVTNFVGTAGTIGSVVYNAIGTDAGSKGGTTINTIGNTNALTQVRATAGTSSMVMIQGALDMASVDGASILPGATNGVNSGSSSVQKDASGKHAVVDEHGRIAMVDGAAAQATNSTYLTNGYGTTNGLVLTENGSVMVGGQSGGTAFALSDTGAHFSNVLNGDPVRVSGVADGQSAFEATNQRQLDSGLASVAALAGLPAPQLGKRNSMGFGFGLHNSGKAISFGGQSLFDDSISFKYGVAVSEAAGLVDGSASMGIGFSW